MYTNLIHSKYKYGLPLIDDLAERIAILAT